MITNKTVIYLSLEDADKEELRGLAKELTNLALTYNFLSIKDMVNNTQDVLVILSNIKSFEILKTKKDEIINYKEFNQEVKSVLLTIPDDYSLGIPSEALAKNIKDLKGLIDNLSVEYENIKMNILTYLLK